MYGMKLALHKLITPTNNILRVLYQLKFKLSFIYLINKAWQNGKLKEYLPCIKLDLISS